MDIVRDIMRTNQALTTTPDYQSPNGIAPIIEGITGGIGGLMRSLDRSGGSSKQQTNFGDLYAYLRARRDEYNSKQMGESEAREFHDETWINALKYFGADAGDVDKIAAATGFNQISERAKKQLERDKLIKEKQDTDTYNSGIAFVGPDADIDSIMRTGTVAQISALNSMNSNTMLGKLTPEQQKQALDSGSISVYGYAGIREGWLRRHTNPLYNDMPEEAALMSYKSAKEIELSQAYNIHPTVAKAIVDKAMLSFELSLYGDKVLEDHGLQFYRDKAKEAYKADNEILSNDAMSQFLNGSWSFPVPKGERGTGIPENVMIPGSTVAMMMSQNGSTGSTGAAMKFLEVFNSLPMMQQLATKIKKRYSYHNMRLLFSPDGAALSEILRDNPTAEANIGEANSQALETAANEANSMTPEQRRASNSYFSPQRIFNDAYHLPDGKPLSKEAFEAMYTKPMQFKNITSLLDSTASETDAATEGKGFYFLTKDGQLKYFGMAGNRFANVVESSLLWHIPTMAGTVRPAETLKDLTNAGTLIESGSMPSVIMRDNANVIKENLRILKEYYGLTDEELRSTFNNSQIMKTAGGKRAMSLNALRDAGIQPGSFFDSSFEFRGSVQDAERIVEAIDAGNYDYAVGLSEDTATAVKEYGKAAVEAATSVPYVAGAEIGRTIAGLTEEADRARQLSTESYSINAEDTAFVKPFSETQKTFKDRLMEDYGPNITRTLERLESVSTKKLLEYVFDADSEAVYKTDNGLGYISYRTPEGRLVTTVPMSHKQAVISAQRKLIDSLGTVGATGSELVREGLESIMSEPKATKTQETLEKSQIKSPVLGFVETVYTAKDPSNDSFIIIRESGSGDRHTISGKNLKVDVEEGDMVTKEQILGVSPKGTKDTIKKGKDAKVVKNSDGSYSIKNPDGSTTGKYKTAAEAFRDI